MTVKADLREEFEWIRDERGEDFERLIRVGDLLALLAELEQAERDAEMSAQVAFEANEREKQLEIRVEQAEREWDEARAERDAALDDFDVIETRLVKADTLAEAGKILRFAVGDKTAAASRWDRALAAFEQEQKP